MKENTENEWNVSPPVEKADSLFAKIRATNQEGLPECPVQLVAVALVFRGQMGGEESVLWAAARWSTFTEVLYLGTILRYL